MKSMLSTPALNRKGISLVLAVSILGLTFVNWFGYFTGISEQYMFLFNGLIYTALVGGCIYYIRKIKRESNPASIGHGSFKDNLLKFLLGTGLFIGPMVITILATILFGWASVQINLDVSTLWPVIVSILAVLLLEAIPEELAFRGYLYSQLSVRYSRFQALLLTTLLFTATPLLVFFISKYVLNIFVHLGPSASITGGYLVTMFVFGLFNNYLRVLTGSAWTGIGFHFMFVYINRLVGIEPGAIIQFSNMSSEGPMQMVLITCLLLVFLGLIIYPRISGNRLNWLKKPDL